MSDPSTTGDSDNKELMKIQLDEYITQLKGRELVSTSEVIDMLLDVRNTFFVPIPEEPALPMAEMSSGKRG